MTDEAEIVSTTFRDCGHPACPDKLDMGAVMFGQASPRGWMRNRLVHYLCQEHAHGAHVPAWEPDYTTEPVRAIPTCSCAWAGDPAVNLAGAAEQWETHIRPVWLLDVDGVLNVRQPGWSAAPFHATVYSHYDRNEYRLRWAPALLDRVRAVHRQRAAEIRWCTTWCPEIDTIEHALSLPSFPSALPTGGPLPKGLKTWALKIEAARAVLRSGRRLIWTDDEIPSSGPLHDDLEQAGALTICTSEKRGLQPEDMNLIEAYTLGRA